MSWEWNKVSLPVCTWWKRGGETDVLVVVQSSSVAWLWRLGKGCGSLKVCSVLQGVGSISGMAFEEHEQGVSGETGRLIQVE